ncbi:MAG: hypothetical protein WBL85_11045 [Sedimentisphaerales bacterium]
MPHKTTGVNEYVVPGKHIAAQSDIRSSAGSVAIHGTFRRLEEADFYPEHDVRKESPDYAKVHHDLVVNKDLPCLVCGVKNSTLKNNAENRYGAKQIETHHHIIEWALANAVDPVKFNKAIRPHLAARHSNEPMYQRDMTVDEISAWVDHSPDNLWVLCNVHHRSKYVGIHSITYPLWSPQDLLSDPFISAVEDEISKHQTP